MSKKNKKVTGLVEDFKTMIALVPKLEDFIEVYNEIAEGYQKYRKNGGEAISGIEKHLSIKKQDNFPSAKKKETAKSEIKAPKKAKTLKTVGGKPAVKKVKK